MRLISLIFITSYLLIIVVANQVVAQDRTTESNMIRREVLYNGIELPLQWPPANEHIKENRLPIEVPYLNESPEFIPIDIGRQLFVDDFLVERTNMKRTFHAPEKYQGNPILKPETEIEINRLRIAPNGFGLPGASAAVPKSGGVWWDPDDEVYKMWYEAGFLNTICMAISKDGIHWERPEFDVCLGTNQVLPKDITPDSWTVVPNFSSDNPEEKWTLYVQPPGPKQSGLSLTSPDGIHWKKRTITGKTGDRSTHFFNPFRNKWVYSLRGSNKGRARNYYECNDFMADALWKENEVIPWLRTDENDFADPDIGDEPQLYNFDAVAYESIMLGMFQLHLGPHNKICEKEGLPKITELQFAYSRDGFHFDRPDRRAHIPAERKDVWDRGYVQSIGNVCTVVGDQLYIYYSAFQGNKEKTNQDEKRHWFANGMYDRGATGVAMLRRDGFASMDASTQSGTLTTRPVVFSGKCLFVNAAIPEGKLRVEIRDVEGNPIAPFTLENSIPFSGDETITALNWKNTSDLSIFAGKPVRFHFEMTNGSLYAFWVSKDETGRSDGYLAGGGIGYPDIIDTVGKKALSGTTRSNK